MVTVRKGPATVEAAKMPYRMAGDGAQDESTTLIADDINVAKCQP